MRKLMIATAMALLAISGIANDGHGLWLDNFAASQVDATTIKVNGFKTTDPTIAIAIDELRNASVEGTITIKRDKKLGADAYRITAAGGKTVIAASTPVGALYGAYDIVRRKSAGGDVSSLDISEAPTYALRVLNHWDNPNGTVERGYAGNSIWQWDSLPAAVSPRYAEYARACASVGINAAVLNNVNAKPMMLTDSMLAKVRVIADELRPYGVKTYLSINFASPKVIGGLPTADPLDPAVVKWWKDKIKDIYAQIPDFGGFLVKANSEGEPGPGDYGRSHSQGANMLADALKPYGGVVMWRAFVYNPTSPDRAMQAVEEFTPLDGQFRDNVIIQIKNGPVDFQPREPFSPLFGAMPQTQQMVEFQITQEYLGGSNHLCYLAPLFKECLDADTYCYGPGFTIARVTSTPLHGVSAIAGVANIGDDVNWTGHLFGQSNWYAFGRLAWDPSLTAEQIADEWLRLTFTDDPSFVSPVKQVMLDSREAVVDYMQPIGLHHIFAGNHHYGPEPWYYPEGIRIDWTPRYYHKADSAGVGFDRTVATGTGATAQYHSPLQERIENIETCPTEWLLWFHHVGWTDTLPTGRTLWDEMCHHYATGLGKARDFQRVWASVKGKIDDERYRHVESKLRIQTHDAQWWKDAVLLYFQQMHVLPFPDGYEQPVYDLDYLMQVNIPLGLYGCPTRSQLP